VPPALGWTVLALVFLDELLLVAGAAYGVGSGSGALAGVVAGAAVVGAWWAFASPKAPLGNPVGRPVAKVLVVVAACGALWWAGHPGMAGALLAFSLVINVLALFPSVARLPEQAGR
jgi:hypothetical protein